LPGEKKDTRPRKILHAHPPPFSSLLLPRRLCFLDAWTAVTSQDVRPEIERTQKCALHSCIENPGIFALLIKPIKVIEVSLVWMGIELVINPSAINFDMTFTKF
jgi:hypothetical protein